MLLSISHKDKNLMRGHPTSHWVFESHRLKKKLRQCIMVDPKYGRGLPLDGAAYIFNLHLVMLHHQNKA